MTARLSDAADQVSATLKGLVAVTARLAGVVGGVVSTVHDVVAGVGSADLLTVAATVNVWAAWVRPEYVIGLVHGVLALASSWHMNVAGVPLAWKVKVADVLVVPGGGEESM